MQVISYQFVLTAVFASGLPRDVEGSKRGTPLDFAVRVNYIYHAFLLVLAAEPPFRLSHMVETCASLAAFESADAHHDQRDVK